MKTLEELVSKMNWEGGWCGLVGYGVDTAEWQGTDLEDFIDPVNKLAAALEVLDELSEEYGFDDIEVE